MPFLLQSASEHSIANLATLFNRGFEGYFMPVNFTEELLSGWIKSEYISLDFSRVLLNEESLPIGLALIASRGEDECRLAAMGIVRDARARGTGSWFVEALLKEAYARDEKRMLLEVIVQNEAGVRLYKKFGFRIIRQLFGFSIEAPTGSKNDALKTCEHSLFLEKAKEYALPDLPWQVDEAAMRLLEESIHTYQLGESYIGISDLEKDDVVIRSFCCKNGGGEELLKALFALYPQKKWQLPAIFPEEQAVVFENVGMKKEELSQWQMVVDL